MNMHQSMPAEQQSVEQMAQGLRDWRTDHRGISQRELGLELGVSRETVQAMEAGNEGVAIGTWIRAWRLMGVLANLTNHARLTSHRAGELRMRRIMAQAKAREDSDTAKVTRHG